MLHTKYNFQPLDNFKDLPSQRPIKIVYGMNNLRSDATIK